MIGSVFSIPSLLDSVGEETVNDMLQTYSCVSEGVQLNKEVEKFVRNSSSVIWVLRINRSSDERQKPRSVFCRHPWPRNACASC